MSDILHEKDPIKKVRSAIENYAAYLANNSPDSNECIKIKLANPESMKPSSVTYYGPEGKFIIKITPSKQQITVDAKFNTGNFKAVVTPTKNETKGTEPVFHKHWGKFHEAFDQSVD